jgi:hypothetical protein
VYYKCVKFHKNPISRLGGVALTRYMDGRMDRQGDSYIPPQNFVCGGHNKRACHIKLRKLVLRRDTKGVIIIRKKKTDIQHNGQKKRTKEQRTNNKTFHIKLKIKQHEPH